MLRINVSDAIEGYTLAKNVYTINSVKLLSENQVISKNDITIFQKENISNVYINHPRFSNLNIEEVINEKIRLEYLKDFFSIIEMFHEREKVSPLKDKNRFETISAEIFKKLLKLANCITDELIYFKKPIKYLIEPTSPFDVEINKAFNMAIMSVIISNNLNLQPDEIRNIALAALTHHIAIILKSKISDDIKESFSEKNIEELKNHPYHSFDILRKLRGFNTIAAQYVYQHHERINGKGFPRNLKDDEILLGAQIVGLTDLYYTNFLYKKYRDQIHLEELFETLQLAGKKWFNLELLHTFFNSVPLYQIGMRVLLNNNEIGIITDYRIESDMVKVMTYNECTLKFINKYTISDFDNIFINKILF